MKCVVISQVDSLNDRKEFDQVRTSMRIVGYSTEEVDTIWKLLAAILHIVKLGGWGGGGGSTISIVVVNVGGVHKLYYKEGKSLLQLFPLPPKQNQLLYMYETLALTFHVELHTMQCP